VIGPPAFPFPLSLRILSSTAPAAALTRPLLAEALEFQELRAAFLLFVRFFIDRADSSELLWQAHTPLAAS
jgi:hypothetical protein